MKTLQDNAHHATIRLGDWKLHHYFEDDSLELHNLADDISEQHNLVSDHPDKSQELYQLLDNGINR